MYYSALLKGCRVLWGYTMLGAQQKNSWQLKQRVVYTDTHVLATCVCLTRSTFDKMAWLWVYWTHLWAGTADLTDIAVVDLRGFGRLLGPKLLTLKGGFLGESVPRPGCCRCHSSHRLLLLLLLLLVVAGGSWVNCCLITRVRGSWKG